MQSAAKRGRQYENAVTQAGGNESIEHCRPLSKLVDEFDAAHHDAVAV